MEKSRRYGVGTVRYVNETQGFTMYLLGFQTGYNMLAEDTYDIFPARDGEYPLLSWVENFCRAHPTSNFGNGVVALANEIRPKRQRSYLSN